MGASPDRPAGFGWGVTEGEDLVPVVSVVNEAQTGAVRPVVLFGCLPSLQETERFGILVPVLCHSGAVRCLHVVVNPIRVRDA